MSLRARMFRFHTDLKFQSRWRFSFVAGLQQETLRAIGMRANMRWKAMPNAHRFSDYVFWCLQAWHLELQLNMLNFQQQSTLLICASNPNTLRRQRFILTDFVLLCAGYLTN